MLHDCHAARLPCSSVYDAMLHGLLACTQATKQTERFLLNGNKEFTRPTWVLPSNGPCLPGWSSSSQASDPAALEQKITSSHQLVENALVGQVTRSSIQLFMTMPHLVSFIDPPCMSCTTSCTLCETGCNYDVDQVSEAFCGQRGRAPRGRFARLTPLPTTRADLQTTTSAARHTPCATRHTR